MKYCNYIPLNAKHHLCPCSSPAMSPYSHLLIRNSEEASCHCALLLPMSIGCMLRSRRKVSYVTYVARISCELPQLLSTTPLLMYSCLWSNFEMLSMNWKIRSTYSIPFIFPIAEFFRKFSYRIVAALLNKINGK